LNDKTEIRVQYPDVAKAIVDWLSQEKWKENESIKILATSLWNETKSKNVASFQQAPLPRFTQQL